MKRFVWVAGILTWLLSSCGGGGDSNYSSSRNYGSRGMYPNTNGYYDGYYMNSYPGYYPNGPYYRYQNNTPIYPDGYARRDRDNDVDEGRHIDRHND